jgi:PAP2 superfamily
MAMDRTVVRHRVRHVAGRGLWDGLVILIAYQAYRLVRIVTESKRPVAIHHGQFLLWWERQAGLAWERDVQQLILDHRMLIDLCNLVYTWMFWPVVTGMLLVLQVRDRSLYRRYRNALFLSGGVGLVVFGTFPVAPPRMLDGFVDTVHVFSRSGAVAHPMKYTNEFAAMPSFHVGWVVLAGVAAMPAVPWRRARPMLLLPGLVMMFVVMATANHYLVDGLAGATLALVALAAGDQLESIEWARVRRRLLGPDVLVALGGVVDVLNGHAAFAFHRAVARSSAPPDAASQPVTNACSHHDGGTNARWSPAPIPRRPATPAGSSRAYRNATPGE